MGFFSSPELKVGIFVVAISALIAVMSLKVNQDPSYLTTSKNAWFSIEDASGLVKNSNVRMAGIPVGVIKEIRLENGQARIDMILKGDTPITKSARIEIRPNGILGDKHVEIVSGDPRDPPFLSGDQILVVDDRASVDRLINEVSKITKSISAVADNLKAATEGDADKPMGRIIANVERISSDLAILSSAKRDELSEIISSFHRVSRTFDNLVNDNGPDGFKEAWKGAVKSLKKIESTLKNTEEITGKINRGEGTIGRLISDESTADEVASAIRGINNLVDTSSKIQTSIDYHTSYLMTSQQAKSFLNLKIQPGLDRFYEVGIVDDSGGLLEKTSTKSTLNGVESNLTEEKRFQDRVKFNALFAKNFYNFTVKGGIIENAGGGGFDYQMLQRKLRLSIEGFDFQKVNVRAMARYDVFHGIYLVGGGEDLLGKTSRGANGFLGAGLFLTNDDLKVLLSKSPF
jgi:phospholipid/cholesterol/gamma-HCH transport system substrate-binding protein